MRKFIYLLIGLCGIATAQAAEPSFRSSVAPLSAPLQKKLIAAGVWRQGCPVSLNDLRVISVNYYDFAKTPKTGTIILNQVAASAAVSAFEKLYATKFSFASLDTLVAFNANWKLAEQHNVTYGFLCKPTEQQDDISDKQEAAGNVITINPVQNPAVKIRAKKRTGSTWCKVFSSECKADSSEISAVEILPARGMFSLNRNIQLTGMNEQAVNAFTQAGFRWSGQQVNPISWKKFSYTGEHD